MGLSGELQVSWFASFSSLKMEAAYSSKSSVDFEQPMQLYVPEDRTVVSNLSLGEELKL
jgi:hypothetical protein